MSLILKVQYKDELRRVAVQDDITLPLLTDKVRAMFPQLPENFEFIGVRSEEDLKQAVAQAKASHPPLLRLAITEAVCCPIETTPAVLSCHACKAPLGAVYYKCINCLNVELCERCESECCHTPNHLLVKLRVPLDALTLKQRIIFASHLLDPAERQIARKQKKELRSQQSSEHIKRQEERRKERAQKKLQRLEQKMTVKKLKTEKKRRQKVKKLKKIPVASAVVEPVVDSTFIEIPAKPVEPEIPIQPVVLPTLNIDEPKTEFNILKFMAEFQLLKKEAVAPPVQKEEAREEIEEKEPFVVPLVIQDEEKREEEQEKKLEEVPLIEEEKVELQPVVEVAQKPVVEEPVVVVRKPNPFERNLQTLAEMGFSDRKKNIEVLVSNLGNLEASVEQLLRDSSGPRILSWLPFNLPL